MPDVQPDQIVAMPAVNREDDEYRARVTVSTGVMF